MRQHFTAEKYDLVLGIDSPDFNLGLCESLRSQGQLTAHYVSPSVWAWRQNRIKKIQRAVDLMLTLFPFEEDFYRQHNVPVKFVGHPLADQIAMHTDPGNARSTLGLPADAKIVALLPGSRRGEVKMMGEIFLQTAMHCSKQLSDLHFVLPAANEERRFQLEEQINRLDIDSASVTLLDGHSQLAMAASNVVLMASGTTSLEALLLKKPMVVAYKMAPLSYAIISRMLKAPYVSLPNLLADEALVPEILQNDVTVESLSKALLSRLQSSADNERLLMKFETIHQQLQCDASNVAAQTLLKLIEDNA